MAKIPDIEKEKYRSYFSDSGFWDKLRTVAVKAGASLVYPALLLYYVMESDKVSLKYKLYIMGALGYLILPTDLLPDFIPFFGYADDAAALVTACKLVADSVTPEIKAKAKAKALKWFGLADVSRAEEKLNREIDEQ